MAKAKRKCLNCERAIEGRIDKKYCDAFCRVEYHNLNRSEDARFVTVDRQLRLNRKILKKYNQAGYATADKSLLDNEGFDKRIFTNYWKSSNRDVYLFCYEYGFILKKDRKGKMKYTLIKWQDYMK